MNNNAAQTVFIVTVRHGYDAWIDDVYATRDLALARIEIMKSQEEHLFYGIDEFPILSEVQRRNVMDGNR